ncbi:hypothetical protein FDP41_005587 [Naegleria fowleri]|uniref:Knr4/Smi1-like domain-containing protein n=1 Tax=Naegleria fowleri TaxID=5763 RepID=A0A6A5BCF4_NAEFO|nr:uncharacterized protein FDP41_005587 [Naegleria fowleri]KAF0975593.1 hypothetical protein FDP41_005587 [Naegleria fowleri]
MFLRLKSTALPNDSIRDDKISPETTPHSHHDFSRHDSSSSSSVMITLFLASDTVENVVEFIQDQDREMVQQVCRCFQEACRVVERREFLYMWHDENRCLLKPLSEPPVDEQVLSQREMELKTKFPLCLREFLKITNGRPSWSDDVLHVNNLLNRVELWKYDHSRKFIILGLSTQNSNALTLDPKKGVIRLNQTRVHFKHFVTMQNRPFHFSLYDQEKFQTKKYFPYSVHRSLYSLIPSTFASQRNMTLKCVQCDGLCLEYACSDFKKDPQIVREAYLQNPKSFKFCSEELRNQLKFVKELFRVDPQCLTYLPITHELFYRKEFMLEAIQIDGSWLRKASHELRNDREVVMKAIESYPNALSYASKELRSDEEVVMTALKRNVKAFQYVDPSLYGNETVLRYAIEHDGYLFQSLPEEFRRNQQLALLACKTTPFILKKFDFQQPISQYREFALQAVKNNAKTFYHLPSIFSNDREIVMTVIQSPEFALDNYLFHRVGDDLRSDKEVVKLAIQHNPMALQYAGEAMREDLEIVLPAIRKCGKAFTYISKKLQCKQYIAMQRNADQQVQSDPSKDDPRSITSENESLTACTLKKNSSSLRKKDNKEKKVKLSVSLCIAKLPAKQTFGLRVLRFHFLFESHFGIVILQPCC